jgi:NAD(P)-dependent dehydrogenase (short-subunit alcohol dehydrogenase family)
VIDILQYEGKTCVVTGAASGMGDACARTLVELGAEVIGLDVQDVGAPVKESMRLDLMQESSIDDVVSKLPARIDRLFNCAGVPGAPRFSALDTMVVNFIGLKHLTEAVIPRIPSGGAIASITSVAGMGYAKNMDRIQELLALSDFGAQRDWCAANPEVANGYLFSKQMIIVYTFSRAAALAEREVRINCLSPAPTDTPMMPAFYEAAPKEFMDDHFQAPVGRNATPAEMAEPLILLNSHAARFVSGHNLYVDYGYTGQVFSGQRPGLLLG